MENQTDREKAIDERFEKIEAQLSLQPTLEQFNLAIAGLAKTEDIARLNNIVHNFTIAAQLLEAGSKWAYRALLVIAAMVVAFGVIGGGIKDVGMWLGVHFLGVK